MAATFRGQRTTQPSGRAGGTALPQRSRPETNMSMMLSTIAQPAARRPHRLVRIVYACARGIAHFFERRDAVKNLAELTDRELQDIGIRRCQIEEAVHGTLKDIDLMKL
jgi:uncharacterized protein YjiS (DUF1127 family)